MKILINAEICKTVIVMLNGTFVCYFMSGLDYGLIVYT
jgi:hypothetical protein